MKKIFLYCVLSLISHSVCSAGKNDSAGHVPMENLAPLGENTKKYACDIRSAIEKNFFIEDDFHGKQCTLKVVLTKEGGIEKVLQARGDKPLCDAALKAIRNADIPAAPDDETYKSFKNSILEFTPM